MVHEVVQQNEGKAYTHGLFSNVKFETKLQDDVKTKLEHTITVQNTSKI